MRASAVGGFGPRDPASRRSSAHSFSAAASAERNIKAEAASKRRCASPPYPGAAGRPLPREISCSLSPKARQTAQPTPPPKPSLMLSPARLENRLRFSSLKNSRSPKQSPTLRPVSASLRLRCRSAGAARHPKDSQAYPYSRRPRQFLPDWPSANRQNMPSLRGRARPQGVLMPASTPVLCSRAWGNLVKTCQHILTIPLFRRRRAL